MTTTTRHPAPGVAAPRTFDHADLAEYPEYHHARRALDALARALDRDDSNIGRAAFVEAAADMARTSYAADWCHCPPCRTVALKKGTDLACWPHAAQVHDDGWMRGTYRCPRTGANWHCGYASPHEGIWP